MAWFFFLPVTISFFAAGIPHALVKLGYTIPNFFLEPTFAVYCVFIGSAVSLCLWFRQLMLFLLLFLFSTIGLVVVYIWYVI